MSRAMIALGGRMSAITVDTTVNEPLVRAIPELRPLFGKPVRLIAEEVKGADVPAMSWEEFLQNHQLQRPPGTRPVSVEDMERAIAEGALGR